MDKLDTNILSALQKDGQISMSQLSSKVGLSLSACHRRVKTLEANGMISHYTARLNAKAIGLEIQVFIAAKLTSQRQEDIIAFEKATIFQENLITYFVLQQKTRKIIKKYIANV
jgi:Lrp/AsnC family leucine-responsive transcriptional regulator